MAPTDRLLDVSVFIYYLSLSGEYYNASEFENVNITAVRSFLYYKSDDK